jgi:hypothetical protein
MIGALPDDAIKVFTRLSNGKFSVIPQSHPYAAFRRLGAREGGFVRVIAEDRLAVAVIKQAIFLIDDHAERSRFKVDFVPGGANAILKYRIPVLMEDGNDVFIMLDGDKKEMEGEIEDPDDIAASKESELPQIIKKITGGIDPELLLDGFEGTSDARQKASRCRSYIKYIRSNLRYLPLKCPEAIVLKSAGKCPESGFETSAAAKQALHKMASETLGDEITADKVDNFGESLLGMHRSASDELKLIAQTLREFSSRQRPKPAVRSKG